MDFMVPGNELSVLVDDVVRHEGLLGRIVASSHISPTAIRSQIFPVRDEGKHWNLKAHSMDAGGVLGILSGIRGGQQGVLDAAAATAPNSGGGSGPAAPLRSAFYEQRVETGIVQSPDDCVKRGKA